MRAFGEESAQAGECARGEQRRRLQGRADILTMDGEFKEGSQEQRPDNGTCYIIRRSLLDPHL